jgi:hypothetical protein
MHKFFSTNPLPVANTTCKIQRLAMKKNPRGLFNNASLSILGCLIVFAPVNRADSQLIVWGDNSFGQTTVPATVTNVMAMAAGDYHILALSTNGIVAAWGGNEFNYGETNVPIGLTNVVSIAAGSASSLALHGDGTVTIWGQIVGLGVTNIPPSAKNVVALALGPGAQHALVLRADGTPLDWGRPTIPPLTNMPPTARDIVSVAAGSLTCVALRSDGKVVAWGINQFGATNVPASATNIVAIATGWYTTAALRADGTVLAWGGSVSSPSTSQGFTNVIDLACPFNNSGSAILALRNDGNLALTSYPPGSGWASVPANATNIVAVGAGSYNGMAQVGSGPPVFPGIPVNRTVAGGATAYFRMLAVGAFPLSYQWNCNGTPITGATNSVLAVTNVQPGQSGNYYTLTASNALGMATNGAMTLTEVPLEFSIQPAAQSTPVGATAKFSIAYTNGAGPFSFQWQSNGISIDGATNIFLSLTNVQLNQAGTYSAIVGNSYGAVTNSAVLTVQPFTFNTGLTNPLFTTNGMQLQLIGVFATNSVILYASTDLVSWLPILTNSAATGSVQFLDASATNWPLRFYRSSQQ